MCGLESFVLDKMGKQSLFIVLFFFIFSSCYSGLSGASVLIKSFCLLKPVGHILIVLSMIFFQIKWNEKSLLENFVIYI